MTAKSQFMLGGGGQTIQVYEDRVVARTRPFIARVVVQEVRYDQVAGVSLNRRIGSSDLIVETRGGDHIEVKALVKRDAERIAAAIRDRM